MSPTYPPSSKGVMKEEPQPISDDVQNGIRVQGATPAALEAVCLRTKEFDTGARRKPPANKSSVGSTDVKPYVGIFVATLILDDGLTKWNICDLRDNILGGEKTWEEKRGRPSKYGSKEEKARQDVIAKRARRRLRSTAAHRDTRFQVYVAQMMEAGPTSSAQSCLHLQPSNCLGVLADAASLAQRIGISPSRSLAINPSEMIAAGNESHIQFVDCATPSTGVIPSPHPIPLLSDELCNTTQQCKSMNIISRSPEPTRANMLLSYEVEHGGNNVVSSHEDNEGFLSPALQLSPSAMAPVIDIIESEQPALECTDRSADSNAKTASPKAVSPSENGASRQHEVENTNDQAESRERADSDIASPSEDAFEAESNLWSDISDTQGDSEIEECFSDATNKSNYSLAKGFLKKTWGRLCDCQEGENTESGRQLVFNLKQMAEYWQNLGVPDSIGPTVIPPEADETENTYLEWSSI
ncbi:hypothetical protein BGZ63DRAFT_428932 [Mariannaea sp. PMI_226]|nr:hypothetical protein BGZ63DRAFT_428932 [Mariannaea sp. PMI_226]